MKADAIRSRIQQRIEALGTNMQKVSLDAGLKRTYLQEFMIGKKASTRGDAMGKIAGILGVTEEWLLTGRESPTQAVATPAPTQAWPEPSTDVTVTHVYPSETAQLVFDSLDLQTGACSVRAESGVRHIGRVVDPALAIAGNAYATSLLNRAPHAFRTKTVILSGGLRQLCILDTSDWNQNRLAIFRTNPQAKNLIVGD